MFLTLATDEISDSLEAIRFRALCGELDRADPSEKAQIATRIEAEVQSFPNFKRARTLQRLTEIANELPSWPVVRAYAIDSDLTLKLEEQGATAFEYIDCLTVLLNRDSAVDALIQSNVLEGVSSLHLEVYPEVEPQSIKRVLAAASSLEHLSLTIPLTEHDLWKEVGEWLEKDRSTCLSTFVSMLPDGFVARHAQTLSQVERLSLSVKSEDLNALLRQDCSEIRSLSINRRQVLSSELSALCKSLHNLTELNLFANKLTADGIRSLAKAEFLPNLEQLGLYGNPVGDEGISQLSSFLMPRLQRFDLDNVQATAQGIRSLARSNFIKSLEQISVTGNEIGDDGASALSEITFSNLRRMRLQNSRIGDEGVTAISQSSIVSNLESLAFADRIGEAGIRALSESPASNRLNELVAIGCVDDKSAPHLASFQKLEILNVYMNRLSDRGVEVLSEAEFATTLLGLLIHPLSHEAYGDHALDVLCTSALRPTRLSICTAHSSTKAVERLANSAFIDRLEELETDQHCRGSKKEVPYAPWCRSKRLLPLARESLQRGYEW